MKLFRSIRWRLQIWYGLILVAVLVGFGFTAYQLERGRQFRRIDEELQRRAIAVANALRPPPMRGRESMPQRPLLDRGPDRPPPGPRFNPPPDQDVRDRLPQSDEIQMRVQRSGLFDESDTNGFYYIVWSQDGKELARSANTPAETMFLPRPIFRVRTKAVNAPPQNLPQFGRPEREPPQTYGQYRGLGLPGPAGVSVYVGRSIASELKELNRTALKLAGVGGVILLLGLAGGWWIATRAIRPIQDISGTAVRIAAGDLSQRINSTDTDSELGQLAGVLNSTFSRLETAFAQQRQFTADVAHELRTPVSVMLTETQTALNRERNASEYRDTVEVCQRAAQRMRRLIESLLELVRLDAGQERMKRMQFDLSGVARDCVELIRPLADGRGVKIHCDLPPVECTGDPEHLAQVVTNLLANAVNYSKDNGEVRVSVQSQDGMAAITVTDTGVGISADHLPHVFERFYRADASRSSGHAGLGLAISKAIIEAHGGTIEVTSQPGEGSTFTVRLPVAQRH